MSADTVLPQLELLQTQIAGINRAFADAPNSITVADAPLFINLPAEGDYDDDVYGDETYQETDTYRMILYVAPRGSGISGEVVNKTRPFLKLVKDFFVARPQLGGLTGVQKAKVTGHGGIVALKFGDDDWVGVEFKLSVIEATPFEYAPGE